MHLLHLDATFCMLFLCCADPAQILIHPNQTTEVDAYNTISFTCVAFGDPVPSITWNKGDTELVNDSRVTIYESVVSSNGVTFMQSILVLCGAEQADAGEYSCFTENTFGNGSVDFVLSVNARGKVAIY